MPTPRITLTQAEDLANNLRAYLNGIGLDLTASNRREDQTHLYVVEGD